MPFNTELHAQMPYVDHQYKEMLIALAQINKRSLKGQLEAIIADATVEASTKKSIDKSVPIPYT